jgi:prevent-host-death family protein
MQVNVLEAKNQLSQLIRLAQAGDQVIIANRGAPVAQLIPIQAASPSQDRNFLKWLASNLLPAHAQRSAQEIDAAIADERAAWD